MKKTLPRKYSQRDIPRLKRILWKHFSLYIRRRDNYTCYTCGRWGEGGAMHAGHLIPTSLSQAVRFNEFNVNAQCYHCNINLSGNGAIYSQKFIRLNGQEAFDNLIAESKIPHQWTVPELETLIEKYSTQNQ